MQELTADDIETHFADLCEIPDPATDDPAPFVFIDPFVGTERFIRQFADRENLSDCLGYLAAIQRSMETL